MKYVALTEIDNDVLLRGDGCCTNLKELYEALVDPTTTEIHITKDFANAFFSYMALCEFFENSAALVPHVRIVVDDTVYDSSTQAVKDVQRYKSPDEFIYALEFNPTRVISTIQLMCKSFLEAADESSIANNKIATMQVQLEDLHRQLEYKETDYKRLQERYNDTHAKLDMLVSRINFRYEKTVNPDEMLQLTRNSYNHVLYVKEITRVHYVDTLLYYLQEIMKTLYSVPVRTVVIEPYYAYDRCHMYKGFKPHWDLTYQDVYAGDIYMAGFQPKVMKDILQDPNHVNYLIVLDRGGYIAPHVIGDNVSTIYTVSDLKDADSKISNSDLISYDDATMFIPYIDGFEALSPEDKVQKYSSMNVTKELIRRLEEVS